MNDEGSITGCFSGFRRTGNPAFLARALVLSFRQGRLPEIARSAAMELAIRPSTVSRVGDDFRNVVGRTDSHLGGTFTREGMAEKFGNMFLELPKDFQGTRWSNLCPVGDLTVVGEYFEGKRLFLVGRERCLQFRRYLDQPDVRHIHSVISRGDEILVSTGDARKALDLWRLTGEDLVFVKRLRKHSAGFTGATKLGGKLFFGTDFSSRPNWIETGRKRFPFPRACYRFYVEAMQAVDSRFIVTVNKDKLVSRGRKVWSVFDAVEGKFLYSGERP